MKIIYMILLTTTTWYDGHPYTRGVGMYETPEACQKALKQVVETYKKTFPPHIVTIQNVKCDKISVPEDFKIK